MRKLKWNLLLLSALLLPPVTAVSQEEASVEQAGVFSRAWDAVRLWIK
jgi:hypothetical protein